MPILGFTYTAEHVQALEEGHALEIASLKNKYRTELEDYRRYYNQHAYDRANYGFRDFVRDPWNFPITYGMTYYPTTPILIKKSEVPLPVAYKHHILISSDGAATHPVQHPTLSAAEAEATRVAKKFPGREITIYTAVKSFKVEDKPVTVKTFV